jgi:uncharacterized protein YukE|tara:strand:+ start:121 stop:444 length:324 start_codon:yes stop_codon:yes gene_type:complete
MIKLKDILKESSPGYENRQFGDPLPTLEDIAKKYQEKNGKVNESTDVFDYNEMAIDALESSVSADGRAWRGTTKIMENKEAYAIVKKYTKPINKLLDRCDKELRKLK